MLDQETLQLVETEVKATFEIEEIKAFSNFEDFFSEVDVQNTFEEDWKPDFYKPFYEFVFKKLRGGL